MADTSYTFRITIDPRGLAEVTLNGERLDNLESVVVRASGRAMASVELTFVGVEVEVKGESRYQKVTERTERYGPFPDN